MECYAIVKHNAEHQYVSGSSAQADAYARHVDGMWRKLTSAESESVSQRDDVIDLDDITWCYHCAQHDTYTVATHEAEWHDASGRSDHVVRDVCAECLAAGSDPGYSAVD